jgi:hypothetical protein
MILVVFEEKFPEIIGGSENGRNEIKASFLILNFKLTCRKNLKNQNII